MISLTLALLASATGDPCGMVPPISAGPDAVIERDGAQRTYVMHSNGVETLALRPGFVGSVEQFGMLIPFPTPPAIRKIDDDTFAHIEAAVDPPEVQVFVQSPRVLTRSSCANCGGGPPPPTAMPMQEGALRLDEVRVLNQEAVGMYQVAVLEAGSAKALDRWMSDNGYRYPEGMDTVVNDYVGERWCFVAVKAKVGATEPPRPGMRDADTGRAPGSTFDGHVQGMGFRFETDAPVIPMRLSVFNGEDPRNVVYLLTDSPVRAADLDTDLVVRQVPGETLHANLTQDLPVSVEWDFDASASDRSRGLAAIPDDYWRPHAAALDPVPYSGVARDLFAADLLAVRSGTLLLEVEAAEKELLNINEAFGLRGDVVDGMVRQVLDEQTQVALDGALDDVKEMHLTVLDGVFDHDVLARQNVRFEPWTMPSKANKPRTDAIRPAPPTITIWRNW